MRRAVIDIGTNTVKLLVADIRDGQVFPVVSKDLTTRLGEGVDATRQLSPAAIARTVAAITGYVADAQELAVADLTAFTTSAARDAGNRQEFLAAVHRQSGLTVEVLTGQREAELIFRGVASDPAWSTNQLLVLDIGGGSAEFIQGAAGKIDRWQSLPLGAVRLTEQFRDRSFAELAEYLRTTLRAALTGYGVAGRQFIATGGATITLGRVATGKTDRTELTFEAVRGLVAQLNALPLAELRKVPGLPPDRADIIVAGGAVLMFAMEALGATDLTVSTRNLRYGALLS
jgi:exopolyphosphatase / guanosine-5'-triphosphate,3'-diphosphate pyrophosphatase